MRNATMIWSSMDHERDNILVLDNKIGRAHV